MEFFFHANYSKDVYITNHFIYRDFETDDMSTFAKHETILYFCNAGLPNIQITETEIFFIAGASYAGNFSILNEGY